MLGEICIVGNCFSKSASAIHLAGIEPTLIGGQEAKLVSRRRIERVALAIIAVLENDTEPIRGLHQDLDDSRFQVGEPGLAASLSTYIQVDRAAGFEVGVVEEVPLLEGGTGMRLVSSTVWEVVNLEAKSVAADFMTKDTRRTGWSIVYAV